jgi:hypothetical protein
LASFLFPSEKEGKMIFLKRMTILMGVAAAALNGVVAELTPSLHTGNPAGKEITYKGG